MLKGSNWLHRRSTHWLKLRLFWIKLYNSLRVFWVNLQRIEISTCAQSDLGLPLRFFQDVPVRRGRNSVWGSKHTNLNGRSSGRRSMCPNHRNWAFNIWLLKGTALHRFRTITFEIRLIKAAGILAIRLNIRACALSREALTCEVEQMETPPSFTPHQCVVVLAFLSQAYRWHPDSSVSIH